jgi:hypothetical protein
MEENLQTVLEQEIKRCQDVLDTHDPGTDEYNEANEQLNKLLGHSVNFVKNYNDTMNNAEKISNDDGHAREMERIEKQKLEAKIDSDHAQNETQLEIERSKQNVNWTKVGIDVGKVVLAAGLSWLMYSTAQKREMEYDSNGNIHRRKSTGDVHLPKMPDLSNIIR